MDRANNFRNTAADLRQSYRAAFLAFADKQRQVQQLTNLVDIDADQRRSAELERALVELESARRQYGRARDLLAVQLLGDDSLAAMDLRDPESTTPQQVRAIAQVLWEAAGRPEGSAQNDWFRAERIAAKASLVAA